jgi:hypothetical protein
VLTFNRRPPSSSVTAELPLPLAPSSPPGRVSDAASRPPRWEGLGPGEAILRHRMAAALPVLVLLVAAVAFGVGREAVLTVESRVLVGRVDGPSAQIPGLSVANQQLASAYARLVGADSIQAAVKKDVGGGHVDVTASPVPESTVIRIEAKAGQLGTARRGARAAATELVTYVQSLNAPNPSAEQLKASYNQAVATQDDAAQKRDDLKVRLTQLRTPGSSAAQASAGDLGGAIADTTAQLVDAQKATDLAKLDADTLALQYRDALDAQSNAVPLTVVTTGQFKGSDRRQTLALLATVAAVIGLGLGAVLAIVIDRRTRGQRRT